MAPQAEPYIAGLTLIEAGLCPIGTVNPMACWTCPYGHATECHHPLSCEEAECSHWQADDADAEALLDEFEADHTVAATAEDLELPYDPDAEDVDGAYRLLQFEADRQARIAAGVEHACARCGCSETRACPGGCVWATGTLCSRCV